MSRPNTVSGNTVSGNTPPQPETTATTETVTNNNTYTIDNTDVCNLLTALLQEEVKQNEALERLNETLADHIKSLEESGLYDSLQDQVLAEDIEEETNTAEETETDSETLFDILHTINDTLTGSQETLDSINMTVSGNNTFLDSMDGTTTALQETYTKQTEKSIEAESNTLAIGITLIFAVSALIGVILSKTVWHKMR